MIVWLGIGLVLAALAVVAPLRWAAAIVIVCLPLAGTAVMMLGQDPVLLPLLVSFAFVVRHAASLLNKTRLDEFLKILRSDWALVAFVAYCVVSGLMFPRLFESQILVTPQVGSVAQPLGPWMISLVQIAYLVMGAWTCLALRQAVLRVGMESMLSAVLIQAALIGGFGLLQAMLGAVGVSIPLRWIVNNEGYVLLVDIVENGFMRITSVFVEASSFAQWGVGALAFCYALYVSGIAARLSLALCAVLTISLLLSTSSTAYGGMLVIGVFALAHAMLDQDKRRRERAIVVVLAGAVVAGIGAILVLNAEGGFFLRLRQMVETMTVHKAASSSAIDRGAWAARSFANAMETGFLGIGYGVGRSSGMFAYLAGVVGAPGLILFVLAFWPRIMGAFRPLKTGADAVSGAACFGLVGAFGAMAFSGGELALPNMFWAYAALGGLTVTSAVRNGVPAQTAQAAAPA